MDLGPPFALPNTLGGASMVVVPASTTTTLRRRRSFDTVLPTALDDIVLSSLHDLFFILSPSTTIIRVSTNCLSILGCEPDLLLGQRLAALIHGDDVHVFASELDNAMRLNAAVPFRFYCRIRSAARAERDYSAFELVGRYQTKLADSLSPLHLMTPPPGIFSITARPAFTTRGAMLDEMLDLKTEEIRLLSRIAELRQEGDKMSTSNTLNLRNTFPAGKSAQTSGLSTNPAPGQVLMGDAGIPYLTKLEGSFLGKTPTATRLTKRKVVARETGCDECGTFNTPEWRLGPNGPKTLCNACGRKMSFESRTQRQMLMSFIVRYSKAKRKAKAFVKEEPKLKEEDVNIKQEE
ncbi:PAS domain-containing protein [Lasiodiplodia theobromae]|nr:PAS domain-containing protein [Lasiodiplodia theobromae]